MTCLGEGGAVTTDDEAFAEVVRQKKTFGYIYGPELRVLTIGFNYRMTKVQCAVGLSQLEKVDRVIAARRERMVRMNSLLEDVDEIVLPAGHGPGHGSHLYVIRLETDRVSFARDGLRSRLKDAYGVATVVHYPAVWSWEAFRDLGYSEDGAVCPVAAKACRQVLSLPIFSDTSEDDLAYVAWAVKQSLVDLK
jgi:dTDP-4-amino-4,6-dideoxygalactose transaminase